MKKYMIILGFLLLSSTMFAQQDALFSQYMFNKLVINPAYAGTRDAMCMSVVGRQQWVDLEGAPRTLTFSLDSPIKNRKVGLGFYIYTDEIGPLQDAGFLGTFSYIVRLGKGKLSFGLQAGVKYTNVDLNKMDLYNTDDILVQGHIDRKTMPDANFGLYYYTEKFYVGFSSKHLFEQDFLIINQTDETVYNVLVRHFYGIGGVAIPIGDRLVFRPSMLVKYVKNAPLQVDLNASFLINDVLWIGASYRTQRAMVFMIELNISKHLKLGYSYDAYINELFPYNKGSHEIMLGYCIDIFKDRMLTPRFF